MGSIYKRGGIYWIKYYKNGKSYRESTKSDKMMVAKKLLAQREGDIAQGKIPGIHFEKVKFDDLAEEMLSDYRVNQKKSLERAEISVNHLKVFFGGMRAVEITTGTVKKYIESRLEAGAANATINRELSAIKRMLNLGAHSTPPRVDRVPHIPMLKENNTRKGFFEHSEFLALRDAVPDYLKGLVTFAYKSGWRKTEITKLQWSQVDLEQGIVTLHPGDTKNDDARTVYLDTELKELFQRQWHQRKEKGRLTPYVFPNETGMGEIKDFRGSWDTACKGVEIDKLFHDFRRTAVRNMVRAGVPERVAMQISGHRTRSVFERYNIVSEEDLRLAATRQEQYLSQQKDGAGTKTGTVTKLGHKKRSAK